MPQGELLEQIKAERQRRAGGGLENGSSVTIMDIARERERRRNIPEPTLTDQAIGVAKDVGGQVLEKAIQAGEAIDAVTGAPTRAAVQALQQAENPLTAFASQFAEDPAQAPTGKELAQAADVPESSLSDLFPSAFTEDKNEAKEFLKFEKGGVADITASGFAGLGLDVILDPTTLFGGAALKGVKKGTELARKAGKVKKIVDTGKPTLLTSIKKGAAVTKKDISGLLERTINPRQSKEFERLLDIADKHKIKASELPEAVEFGKTSFPSTFERFKAEGPLGEETLKKFGTAFAKVDEALESQMSTIGGVAPTGSAQSAGDLLRAGYDEAFDKLNKNADITYGNIHNIEPGITLTDDAINKVGSKLNGVNKWAIGRIKRGIQGEGLGEAKQIQSVVRAIKNTNGSVKQTVEVMQDIGRLAFKQRSVNDLTPRNVKKLKELYFSLSEGVLETVGEKLGPELAGSLKENNKLFSEFFKDKKFIEIIGNERKASEDVFKSLVSSGDTKQIAVLKKLLSPEKLQQIKGEYLASLVTRLKDGGINFTSFSKKLMAKEGPLGLFTKDEIKNLTDIIDLQASLGEVVLSRSGTGASNRFKEFLLKPLDAISSSATGEALSESVKAKARNFPARQLEKKVKDTTRAIKKAKNQTERERALELFKKGVTKKTVTKGAKGARLLSSQTERERALDR